MTTRNLRPVRSFPILLVTALTLALGSVSAVEPEPTATWKHLLDTLEPVDGTVGADVPSGVIALGVEPRDPQYLVAPVSDDRSNLGPAYTIEALVLPVAVDGWKRIVLRWGGEADWAYHLAIHEGRASLFHGQSDNTYRSAEGGSMRPNQAYQLVGVARPNEANPSESRLEVYLDGQLVASETFDGTIGGRPRERLAVGDSASIPAADSRFRGYLAGVTLWNRALSAEEIRARGHNTITARLTGLSVIALRKRQEKLASQLVQREEVLSRLTRLGVERIVFVERGPGRDYQGHYYANFGYACVDPDYWLHAVDGGRLLVLDVVRGKVDVLLDDPGGSMRDPQVSYDGQTVLFSYRPEGTHHYNLHAINVDGSNLEQITSGDFDDIEPTWLPDGGIAFCSSRCNRYIGCWLAPSAVLFRRDADGDNLRMLSSGVFTENTPNVLPDGRILYTRWEYVNRDAVSFHHLWTMNPDGTGATVFFGNQHPGSVFIDARPVPDSGGIVLIDSPGHGRNEHAGFVATLAPSTDPNRRGALRRITREASYRDPFPIAGGTSPRNEGRGERVEQVQLFLAAKNRSLVVLGEDGSESVLFEGDQLLHEPRVVRRRQPETTLPPRTDPTQPAGTIVLADATMGRAMRGIAPGTVKRLLVLEDLPKPANFHGGGSQPIGHGVTSTLKRILGTVPVEPDGSAHFTVPPLRSLYFALLDERDRSIKQMRSFVTVQPGETIGCVGCHEPRHASPATSPRALQALKRPASPIEAFDDFPDIPEFPRDVQPILDRHCLECHNPDRRDGGVNLSGHRGPVYSAAYYELLLHWQVKDTQADPRDGSGRQPGNDPPWTTYSSASPLMDKLDGSHYDVVPSPAEVTQVRLWIDAGVQYPGTYAAYGTGQIGGCWRSNEPIREMADAWPETPPAIEAVNRRCGGCHPPTQLPRHVTARIPLDAWGDMLAWTRPLSRYSRHRLFDLTRPDKSLLLKIALDANAGGFASGPKASDADTPAPGEDRRRPPSEIEHPIVFSSPAEPDYQSILAHIDAAGQRLNQIKRFDMPGFQPNEHYIREMKRYGILPSNLDPTHDPVDPHQTDRLYWQSMWPTR